MEAQSDKSLEKVSTAESQTESKLKRRVKKRRVKPENKCKVCNKVFNFQRDLVKHIQRFHREAKLLECSDCGARFSNTQALACHKINYKYSTHKAHVCKICSKSFIWESLLKRHLLQHTGERPYYCNFCKKTFKQKRNLKKHEDKHADERRYTCSFCEKTYRHERGLRKHLDKQLHTGERPYLCYLCKETFEGKSDLKKHQKIHLKQKSNSCNNDYLYERPHVCKFCSKSFDFESLLKYHLRVHSGERPYSCSVCERTYIRQKDLNKHKRKKNCLKQKSKICEFCSKTFDRNLRLQIHLRTHTGERPFSCSLCEKSFKDKSTLNRHQQIHTEQESNCNVKDVKILKGKRDLSKRQDTLLLDQELNVDNKDVLEKTHVCEFCSKTFDRSLHLKIHLREHTEEATYSSSLCEKSFKETRNLKKRQEIHIKREANCSENDVKISKERRDMNINLLQKAHICKFCSKTFDRSLHLKIHLREHTKDDKCNLKNHQEVHKRQKSNCDKDLNHSKDKPDLSKHHQTGNIDLLDKIHICKFCSKAFDCMLHLKIHLREHAKEALYTCPLCVKSFKDKANLRKHQEIHKNQKLNCDYDSKFSKDCLDKQSNASVIDLLEKNNICNVCSKAFDCMLHLKIHMREHAKEEETDNFKKNQQPKFTTMVCEGNKINKMSSTVNVKETSNLKNNPHTEDDILSISDSDDDLEIIESSQAYDAAECFEKQFNSNESQQKQSISKKNVAKSRTLKFKQKQFIGPKRHFKVQRFGERSYSCCLCNKVYTDKLHLKQHQKIHLKPKSKDYKKNLKVNKRKQPSVRKSIDNHTNLTSMHNDTSSNTSYETIDDPLSLVECVVDSNNSKEHDQRSFQAENKKKITLNNSHHIKEEHSSDVVCLDDVDVNSVLEIYKTECIYNEAIASLAEPLEDNSNSSESKHKRTILDNNKMMKRKMRNLDQNIS